PAPNGETALRAAQAVPPDLILLDITMPGMDGYEVCRQLKADTRLRDIPVLFISALTETEDKVRAFRAGGVDYVGKPFQLEEVEARVRTHLELRAQRLELEHHYARLRELEGLRDSLTHMVAHDMKSPLLAVQLSLDVLRFSLPKDDPDTTEILETARASLNAVVQMIAQMIDVSRLEAGSLPLERTRTDLNELVAEMLAKHRPLAARRQLASEASAPVIAEIDADIIRRVLANLIGNAIKFTPPDGVVRVVACTVDSVARVEVSDNGPGIAPELHATIFEKFGQVRDDRAHLGTGLGLTFCKMAVEAHGGAIGVTSTPGAGSTFWFTLPLTP
ncbi:MAG: hybrid sensor histidine kinase/response regulator, partial [Opitutaceae bacterium]|nr:hybrid sensor histidine kinase/response regulator [Opitutaceae bacterium]